MTVFTQICGTPASAITLLGTDGGLQTYATLNGATQWSASTPVSEPAGQLVLLRALPGGVAVALGARLQYISNLGNTGATWKTLMPALPADFTLGDLTGDSANGFVVSSADGLAVLHAGGSAKKEWKALTAPQPFDKVVKLAGDLKSGVLAISADDPSRVARLATDCLSWLELPEAPIKIELICGDCVNDFVVYGERQLLRLTVTKDGATWAPLMSLGFGIVALSGNPKDGLVALIGDGRVVAICSDVKKPAWTIALGPDAERGDGKIGKAEKKAA